ncbi:uncharacterized protein B0H18DRAFT_867680 [Fomitopsis serialis]|uniref:uncharacterized protein n=1 Tax=Fomitopsis serialis TaxID=139415 RepID=UPI002007C893|nr:uncharacterized protein B0H18DRAFT_867680 [Neoantrodia serialis]KAH9937098.1 hypothetical protein B0H18DRAFT_867680 [Neoantrodia serialis]
METEKIASDAKRRCYQCLAEVDAARMRNHVGEHILKAMRGVQEDLRGQQVVPSELPCGFCGRPERLCTAPTMTKGTSRSTPQARSECPYYRLFFYQPSLKPSPATPCTNVPIICMVPGCKAAKDGNWTAVWKYNMVEHLRQCHPSYGLESTPRLDGLIPLPPAMQHEMHISDEEERALRIPAELIPYKSPLPRIATPELAESTGTARKAKKRRLNRDK